jgi:peptidoglycan DL-endopeptidase CwlO
VTSSRAVLLRRPTVLLAALLFAGSLVFPGLLARPAAAEPSSDELRSELEVAEARLQEIHMQLAVVVEDYNEANVALQQAEAELFVTEQQHEQVSGEVAVLSELAEDHVRRIHKLGPSLELSALLVAGNPTDAGSKAATLRRVLAGQRSDLEGLAAARTAVAATEERLAEIQQQAQDHAESVAERRGTVEQMVADHQDEIEELEAAIAEAVEREEEERRRREEERLRREAEERARQQAEQERREREAAERAAAQRAAEERAAAEAEAAAARSAQERREAEARAAAAREAEEREAAERRAAEQARQEEEAASQQATSGSGGSSGGSGGSSGGSGGSSGGSGGSSGGSGGGTGGGSGSTEPAPSTRRSAQVAVDTALAQVGKPYQWGGSGPNSFDCSGLTSFAWRAAGVDITRTSRSQYAATTRISRGSLQPGDLVFYGRSAATIGHVAMYIGGGRVVEAPYTGTNVRISGTALGRSDIVGYGRP